MRNKLIKTLYFPTNFRGNLLNLENTEFRVKCFLKHNDSKVRNSLCGSTKSKMPPVRYTTEDRIKYVV